MPILPALLGGMIVTGIASGLAAAAGSSKRTKLAPEIIASAKKWSKFYGVPYRWVLATIWIESRGNPKAMRRERDGDVSAGLMQVKAGAQAERLRRHGLTTADLSDPDTNIMVGTEIMLDYARIIRRALAGRPEPAPMDVLLRLAYNWGIGNVSRELKAGRDPRRAMPAKVVAWTAAKEATVAV